MLNRVNLEKVNAVKDQYFVEIFKGSVITFIAKMVAVSFGLLSNIIIAKYYGAEVMGTVALIASFLTIAGLFTTVGLSTSLLRLIPEQVTKNSLLEAKYIFLKSVKIIFIIGAVVSLILWFNIPLIASEIYNDDSLKQWLYITTLLIVIANLSGINLTVIRALRRIELFAFLQMVQPVINTSFLALLAFCFYDPNNPIYVYFISVGTGFAISLFFVARLFSGRNFKGKSDIQSEYGSIDLIKISWPMFLTSAMWVMIGQTDVVMLGAMAETKDVGVYSIVMKLGMIVSFILASINMVLGPKFAELYYSDDMKGLTIVAKKSSRLIFYCSVPLLFLLIVFGKSILSFFDEEFVAGYPALVFIVLGQFINSICGSVGHFMNMTGNQKIFSKIVMSGALLNVVLNMLLIPRYGIEGAALSSFSSACLWNIVTLLYIKRKFGFYMGYVPF